MFNHALKSELASLGIDVSNFKTLYEALAENPIPDLPLPNVEVQSRFPVYTLLVEADKATPLWNQLRNVREQTGYLPVFLGSKEDAHYILENMGHDKKSPQEHLGRVCKVVE